MPLQTQPAPHAVVETLEDPSEEYLVGRARAGDERAIESIMRRHNRLLYRTVRGVLRSDNEVEDVMQEAYLKAFRNLHQFGPPLRLRAWLARIVVNEALMHRRRANPAEPTPNVLDETPTPDLDTPDPYDETARAQVRQVLEMAIDRLPPAFRCVVMLREVEELSVAETAQCLGINEGTVKTRLHRARHLMREDLVRLMGSGGVSMFDFGDRRCDLLVARVLSALRGTLPRQH